MPPRLPIPSRPVLIGGAAASLLAVASAAPAAASQPLLARGSMVCATADGQRVNGLVFQASATAPAFTRPGDPVAIEDVTLSITTYDRPGSTAIRGEVTAAEFAVQGASPTTVAMPIGSGATFTGTRAAPGEEGATAFGPMDVALPDVPAVTTATTAPVEFQLTRLRYTAEFSGDPSSPDSSSAALECTPAQFSPPFLRLQNASGTTGTQTVDTTVALTCTVGGRPSDDVTLGIRGVLPQVSGPDGQIPFAALDLTLRKDDGPSGLAAPFIWGNVNGLSVVADERAEPVFQLPRGAFGGPRNAGGYGPLPITQYDASRAATTTGAGPLTLRIGSLEYGFASKQSADEPVPPYIPNGITCTPKPGQAPLARIAGVAPLNLPVVSLVQGYAFANVGGIVTVRGTRLAGAKYVTIGSKRVRPFAVRGTTEAWVVAPALKRGRYPVSVTTAAGESAPSTGASLTYR